MLLDFLPLFAEELERREEAEVFILLPPALLILFAQALGSNQISGALSRLTLAFDRGVWLVERPAT